MLRKQKDDIVRNSLLKITETGEDGWREMTKGTDSEGDKEENLGCVCLATAG